MGSVFDTKKRGIQKETKRYAHFWTVLIKIFYCILEKQVRMIGFFLSYRFTYSTKHICSKNEPIYEFLRM